MGCAAVLLLVLIAWWQGHRTGQSRLEQAAIRYEGQIERADLIKRFGPVEQECVSKTAEHGRFSVRVDPTKFWRCVDIGLGLD